MQQFIIYHPVTSDSEIKYVQVEKGGSGIQAVLDEATVGSIAIKWYDGDSNAYMFKKESRGANLFSWVSTSQKEVTIPPLVKTFAMVNNLPL